MQRTINFVGDFTCTNYKKDFSFINYCFLTIKKITSLNYLCVEDVFEL